MSLTPLLSVEVTTALLTEPHRQKAQNAAKNSPSKIAVFLRSPGFNWPTTASLILWEKNLMAFPFWSNSTAPIPATTSLSCASYQASIWMNQGTEDDGLVILGVPSGRRFLCKVKAGLRSSLMALDVEEYAWLETADRQLFAIRPNRLPELNCKRPRDRNASCFHNRFDSKMV